MPIIFDALYREFCRARLAEMRKQLLLWPGPTVVPEENCEAGHPDDAADRGIDSSLRDVKQDDSNNEVAPSRGGEQIDDVLDGLVGAVVGGFESAVWAMLRVRTVVEAAVGKWSAQPFVEEQK